MEKTHCTGQIDGWMDVPLKCWISIYLLMFQGGESTNKLYISFDKRQVFGGYTGTLFSGGFI
jgi:hypothetical protein